MEFNTTAAGENMTSPSLNCTAVAGAPIGTASLILGVVFIVGIAGSFAPQAHKILSRQTSLGINPLFVFCATSGGLLALTGSSMLQYKRFLCCGGIGGGGGGGGVGSVGAENGSGDRSWNFALCNRELLAWYSLLSQALCQTIFFLLYLYYTPARRVRAACDSIPATTTTTTARGHTVQGGGLESAGRRGRVLQQQDSEADDSKPPASSGNNNNNIDDLIVEWRLARALIVVWLLLLVLMCAAPAALFATLGGDSASTTWAGRAFGMAATVTTCLQFLPQIYTVFRRKDAGAYSIISLCIQCPGSLGWAAYLVFGGGGTQLTSWLPQLVTGGFQLILLCLCLVYERRRRRRKEELQHRDLSHSNSKHRHGSNNKDGDNNNSMVSDAATPLLKAASY